MKLREIRRRITNVTRAVSSSDITELLRKWTDGDSGAFEKMLPIVYTELRRLAAGYLKKEREGHLLRTPPLVRPAAWFAGGRCGCGKGRGGAKTSGVFSRGSRGGGGGGCGGIPPAMRPGIGAAAGG